MTPLMLATENALPLFHQAMRDEFRKGGSYESILLTCAGLLGLVFAVYILQRWYDRSQERNDESSHPAQLFRQLLTKLALPLREQQLLRELARDRKIKNPTALLISSQLFDTHASQWRRQHSDDDPSTQLARIRTRLFGDERA